MNTKSIVCAVMTLFLATEGSAFAQNYGDHNGRQQRDDQGDHRDNRGWQRDRHDNQGRQRDRRDGMDRGQFNGDRQGERADRGGRGEHGERGAGPNHEFYRGQRLPPEYRNRQYVVDDWRGHHLNAPPRGYHWVQIGGDYVLVAISTGIILQLFLNN